VTVPHKTHALQWVGDGADSMTGWIGAVNTLVFRGEDVAGHNTDCYAAISSIAAALECSRSDLAGMSVDLLGTGGAAYAVAHGLYERGCQLTVYGRSREKTLLIANKCGARAAPWQDRVQRDGDVLINCTTVGMWPEVNASPIPADALYGCRLVFDLVYNPPTTRLLADAAVADARVLSGLDMFVRQAATQFELWTGTTPDTRTARNLIACELERRTKMP
jgi:3-dehydroquinate dehydratase/shikimate dehydrogenase